MLRQRKEFVTIDDLTNYKRPRVRLHAQGIVLRDELPGALIKTKTQQVCRSGEFLVAEIDAKVGGFGMVPDALEGSIVSSHYFLFGVDDSKLHRRFLDFYIRTPMFREQVEAQGSTNYAAIRPSHVLGYEIPLPSLSLQHRIVSKLEDLSARINEARTLRQETAVELGVIIKSRLNAIAARLEIAGHLGDVLVGTPQSGWSARCDNVAGGAIVLSLGAVTGFTYRSSAVKRTSMETSQGGHYWLRKGDLLITRSNTPDLVGHAAIYDGTPSPCIYPDLMMRLELKTVEVERRFVWYWLQSPMCESSFHEMRKAQAQQ